MHLSIVRRDLVVLALLLAGQASADEGDDLLRDLQSAQQQTGPATEASLRGLVDRTLPIVARVMGLPAPSKVNLKVISRAEARTRLLAVLARDYPGDTLKRLGEALAAVGLVQTTDDLFKAAQDLYSSSVSGFYDPHDHVLYLLSDQPMEAQALIVPHELAHAVQDQALSLAATMKRIRANEDAQLALSAAIEGQAQQVASLVLAAQLGDALGGGAELADLLSEGTAGSAGMAAAQAPVPWLGLQMGFPYSAGAKLVAATRTAADPSAGRLLKRLPTSTAQVMNPALYLREERPREGAFNLGRLLAGSELVYATTLGVANLDLFAQLHDQGGELGTGWRGDRLEVVRLGGKTVALWAVNFGSSAQAERLCSAWRKVVGGKRVQADGSAYEVTRAGNTAILTENVPAAELKNVQAAAAAVFN